MSQVILRKDEGMYDHASSHCIAAARTSSVADGDLLGSSFWPPLCSEIDTPYAFRRYLRLSSQQKIGTRLG